MQELPAAFDHNRCCELVAMAIADLVEVSRGLDPSAPVPSCPGWTVAKLLRHTGTVHRWAATMVRDGAPERIDPRSLDLGLPDDDRWLPGWLSAGRDELMEALTAADPDQPMWTWGADQHTRFWPRRMLHETTMHRIDAELSAHNRTPVDAEVAIDGIDELLTNLHAAAAFSPTVADLKGVGTIVVLAAASALTNPVMWELRLLPDGFEVGRIPAIEEVPDPGAMVDGDAESVLLLLARRSPYVDDDGIGVQGDAAVLDHWLAHSALE